MEDSPEVIRQQMDQTMSQLSEKLETLEQQVSETVQSTGTAVNATVEAVQETVASVTESVQDAVHSVSNALDVRRQIERHPWLFFGGSVVAGYLAAELLMGSEKKSVPMPKTAEPPNPSADYAANGNGVQRGNSAGMEDAAGNAEGIEPSGESPSWLQLRDVAIGSLIGVLQNVAVRSFPPAMEYLTGLWTRDPDDRTDDNTDPPRNPR